MTVRSLQYACNGFVINHLPKKNHDGRKKVDQKDKEERRENEV